MLVTIPLTIVISLDGPLGDVDPTHCPYGVCEIQCVVNLMFGLIMALASPLGVMI
jgi:hypothetical protein